jgi:hypothetical protein
VARGVIRDGIRNGTIFRPGECSLCGKVAKIEGHHPDYTKPKEVVWLCGICHAKEMRRLNHD